jgi:hypothetical protein
MNAVFALAQTVAASAVPPTAIAIDANVQALFGTPEQDFAPQFLIAITGLNAAKQEPRYVGDLSRFETFEITGVLWGAITDASNANQQACATFLSDLYSSLDSAINLDPSLGGIVYQSWLAEFNLSFDAELQGRAVQVDFTVYCEALIS